MRHKILLLFISITTSLILSEVILGVIDLPKFYKEHTFPSQFKFYQFNNHEVFYTNTPSDEITFKYDGNPRDYFDKNNEVVHTTNSMGFRGKEFSKKKPKDKVRIAFLGDSFTFGEGVKDQDIFTNRIEKMLNHTKTTEKYECLNFGVGGYNTEQSLFLLKNLVNSFSPDIVVLSYVLNDVEPKLFYFDDKSKTLKRRPREFYISEGVANETPPDNIIYTLRISKLIWKFLRMRHISEETIQYYQALFKNKKLFDINKKSIADITAFCKNNGIKCYIVIIPLLYQLNEKYPFENLHKKVISLVSNDAIAIDLLPDFIGKNDTDLWVHPTDQHPNEVAHKIIADRVYKEIINTFP